MPVSRARAGRADADDIGRFPSATVAAGLATLALAVVAQPASAAELEPIGSFASPTYVTSDPSDPDRLFVVEKAGRVRLVEGGTTSTFLDITSLVDSEGERGLLSIAFDPGFAENGRLYAFFVSGDGVIHVDEFSADGDVASPATRRRLLSIPHPDRTNHNGGQLQLGPDGMLYIATGDGGGGGDPDGNAQDLGSRLGKILRIDPDPPAAGAAPYAVPADNPFVGAAGAAPEIWSYGLRNPWRFSFDRGTGALVIGDVGQASWEEVDLARRSDGGGRGANFGWNCHEGPEPYGPAACELPDRTDPVFAYPHSAESANCSITGGYVSRDPGTPGLAGRYVYADFCAGEIRSVRLGLDGASASGDRAEGLALPSIASFGEDACGRLYVVSIQGAVQRIVGPAPTDCRAPVSPPPEPPEPPEPPTSGTPVPACAEPIMSGTRSGDRLVGGSRGDRILGRQGPDRIIGGPRDDCLRGGRGRDRIRAGAGADRVWPGRGRDRVHASRGADVVRSRDGRRDRVRCGSGRDLAIVDAQDRTFGCERVRRS